jgi:hypothetical protein
MHFVISQGGTVHDVCVQQSSLVDTAALDCMISEYQKITFDPRARPVTIVYPLAFQPQ